MYLHNIFLVLPLCWWAQLNKKKGSDLISSLAEENYKLVVTIILEQDPDTKYQTF